MTAATRIVELIRTDINSEFRNISSTASVFLFSITTVFIAVKAISDWNILLMGSVLWILVLFSALNVSSGTFNKDGGNQKLFFYTLYDPVELIISKIIFNTIYIFAIFTLTYSMFVIFTGMQVNQIPVYFLSAILASVGLSTVNGFSVLISGSTSALNTNLLLSVMALPVAIPILLSMIKITKNLNTSGQEIRISDDIMIIAGIDLLLIGVVILLIKQLWTA